MAQERQRVKQCAADEGPEREKIFPQVGSYKIWGEFLAGGDSIKGDFVIHVGEPKVLPRHID